MSATAYVWAKALHVFGFIMWTGTLFGTVFTLLYWKQADEAGRKTLATYAKRGAMFMDIGAVIAIVAGVYILFRLEPSLLKDGGWMHMKLTAAVLLIGLHGYLRVQVGKHARGDGNGLPSFIVPITYILIIAIVVFVVVRPTSKMWGN